MEVHKEISLLRKKLKIHKNRNHSIGLVPTMGSLHSGHLSLVKKSLEQNEVTVCSIFVNPYQFNNPKDLEKYPRNHDEDLKLLEELGCQIAFCPEVREMYPSQPQATFDFEEIGKIMEGKYRQGHFHGVGLVVIKLFNVIEPDRVYFGEKDLQQLAIIRLLVKDFSYNIEIVSVPIVREESGLALSSRNIQIPPETRSKAAIIYEGLQVGGKILVNNGTPSEACLAVGEHIANQKGIEIEYIECVEMDSFKILTDKLTPRNIAICIAVIAGGVRLIDNVIIRRVEQL